MRTSASGESGGAPGWRSPSSPPVCLKEETSKMMGYCCFSRRLALSLAVGTITACATNGTSGSPDGSSVASGNSSAGTSSTSSGGDGASSVGFGSSSSFGSGQSGLTDASTSSRSSGEYEGGLDDHSSDGPSEGSSSLGTGDGGLTGTCIGASATGPLPWPEANWVVTNVTALFPSPKWSQKTCTITDAAYGGKGDGVTDNTTAFQKAIADCTMSGGGRVDVPAGTYSTGAILLDNDVEIHFETGTIVKFNGNVAEYPTVLTRYQGTPIMNNSPMVYAYQKTNIAVTGPGILDASGSPVFNPRVNFFEPYDCTNVYVQGITLRGTRFWQFHPTLSKNVLFDGVTTVDNGIENNDGFDPESCTNLVLQNSNIEAHDDAMAIKSGRNPAGAQINIPTSCFVFQHNSYQSSGWGLMTLGSELAGGINHVYGYDVKTVGAGVQYLFEIKGNTFECGVVDEIYMDTVSSTGGVHRGIMWADMNYMDLTGSCKPTFGNFGLTHATISDAPFVMNLVSYSAYPIGAIDMSNSTYTGIANPNNVATYVGPVTWTGTTINGSPAK